MSRFAKSGEIQVKNVGEILGYISEGEATLGRIQNANQLCVENQNQTSLSN